MGDQHPSVEPIHGGVVNAIAVRFFRSPAGDQLAWVALADILLAARFPDESAPNFLADLHRDAAGDTLLIETPDGVETAVAFWLGRCLLEAAVDMGWVSSDVMDQFLAEASAATIVAVGPMPQAELVSFTERAIAAQDERMASFRRVST
ncbi:hypothetical protein [Ancylobacter terrae]|uniref:hypothetical protein n=1 Tax=Ancylobacter sp. sgz301288 TaxID=3342077 RepID=UPI00385DFE0F